MANGTPPLGPTFATGDWSKSPWTAQQLLQQPPQIYNWPNQIQTPVFSPYATPYNLFTFP